MADPPVPPQAITAAGNALRERWLNERPGVVLPFGLDPMDWAQTAVEAAAPHIRADERQRFAAELLQLAAELRKDQP